ncbi:MAG TPA: hypothetical protein VNW15_00230 [Rhizomicrobium sp.]|nr:hypothetical protein [Rhizomicrobium sp.]
MTVSRRVVGFGAAVLAVVGAGTIGVRRIFGPWYAPTPYDDLLHQIVDREPAALFGAEAAKTMPHLDVAALAARLRQPGFALSRRARGDAEAGRVAEAGGWLVPETVVFYSALAAQF